MKIENITFDDDARKRLIDSAMKLVNGQKFDEIMSNLSLHEEENRYYNWYHEYSMVTLPYYGETENDIDIDEYTPIKQSATRYDLKTGSASGVVMTKNFGQKTDEDILNRNMSIEVEICVPQNLSDNATLHFEIDQLKYSNVIELFFMKSPTKMKEPLHHSLHIVKNLTNPEPGCYMFNYDRIHPDSFLVHYDIVPGFKIKWFYSGENVSSSSTGWGYIDYGGWLEDNTKINKEFRRYEVQILSIYILKA